MDKGEKRAWRFIHTKNYVTKQAIFQNHIHIELLVSLVSEYKKNKTADRGLKPCFLGGGGGGGGGGRVTQLQHIFLTKYSRIVYFSV